MCVGVGLDGRGYTVGEEGTGVLVCKSGCRALVNMSAGVVHQFRCGDGDVRVGIQADENRYKGDGVGVGRVSGRAVAITVVPPLNEERVDVAVGAGGRWAERVCA